MTNQIDIQSVFKYVNDNFTGYVDELKKLIRIPSCSFDGYPREEVLRCADACVELLQNAGYQKVEKRQFRDFAPFIYAEYLVDESLPTVLLYAHYDVQPPMRDEFWKSPAYEPTERDGRLYGRGAADDKAGILLHAASLDAILEAGGSDAPPVNLKVILEGEEEVASPGLEIFAEDHKELLAADVVIVADMVNYAIGVPAITTSLRGMAALEVEVKALDHPLHSGIWGGPLPDPAMALSKLIAGLENDDGKIAIPEIYEMLTPMTASERESMNGLPFDGAEFRKQSGILDEVDMKVAPKDVLYSLWREPTLTVNAQVSGSKENAGNVLMDSAWCRIGLRLAPGMEYKRTLELVKTKLEELAKTKAKGMIVNVTPEEEGANPWSCTTENPVFAIAKEAHTQAYGEEALFIGCGATIPFVGALSEKLGGIPALLVGVEDPESNAHSENEGVHLEDLRKALLSQILFFEKLGANHGGQP